MVMEALLSISQTLELEQKWNTKLRKKRALAPTNLQKHLSKEEYDAFCDEFSDFCSNYVKQELADLFKRVDLADLERDVVSVVGVGLARGLGFVTYANENGLSVNLYDVSDEALKRGEKVFRKKENRPFYHLNSTDKVEIFGSEGEISFDSRIIVMSQFLQILPRERMEAVMARMSQHIQMNDCRIIIVHPFDNDGAVWGDTTPYTMDEIIQPLQQAVMSKYDFKVSVVRQDCTLYFGCHKYTAFTIARESEFA